MVFGRFRGQPSEPSPEPMLKDGKVDEEEALDNWTDLVKPQSAGTGATTDEEALGVDEAEEIWDWMLEGDDSEDSTHQWILDDFLVAEGADGAEAEKADEAPTAELNEAPEETPKAEEPEPREPTEPTSPAAETIPVSPKKDLPAEEHGYRCRGCNTCIFHGSDILSSNYQAMTGPGYLIDTTQNTVAATETQSVAYSTGCYLIREVSCEFCENKLGVTYVVAPDEKQEYKVGKFLLGADRLILPPGVTHPKAK